MSADSRKLLESLELSAEVFAFEKLRARCSPEEAHVTMSRGARFISLRASDICNSQTGAFNPCRDCIG